MNLNPPQIDVIIRHMLSQHDVTDIDQEQLRQALTTALKQLDRSLGQVIDFTVITDQLSQTNVTESVSEIDFTVIPGSNDPVPDEPMLHQLAHYLSQTVLGHQGQYDQYRAECAIANMARELDYLPLASIRGKDLGIQEKFVLNTLTENEWLTERDIRRFLQATELNQSIHVATPENLSAVIRAAQTEDNAEPYQIRCIVGQEDISGTHWTAVILNVDPGKHLVSCVTDESGALSSTQEEALKSQITTAVEAVYPRSNLWSVQVEDINYSQQPNGPTSGLQALHALISPELTQHSPQCQPFIVAHKTQDLYRHFVDVQLQHLKIEPEILAALNEQVQDQFVLGKLPDDKRHAFLETLVGKHAAAPQATDQLAAHPAVTQVLGRYAPGQAAVIFPGATDKVVHAADARFFMAKLHEKLNSRSIILPELVIKPCTPDIMLGMSGFFSDPKQPNRIQTVELDFTGLSPNQRTITRLKSLLLSLSINGVESVKLRHLDFIDDPKLINLEQSQLLSFIEQRGVSVQIDLPKDLRTSPLQRQLDAATSKNLRQRRIAALGEERKASQQKTKGPVRQRAKINKNACKSADIELQQEAQVEVAVQAQAQKSKSDLEFEHGAINSLSFEEFTALYAQKILNIPDSAYLNSMSHLQQIWNLCLGNVARLNQNQVWVDANRIKGPYNAFSVDEHENTPGMQISQMAIEAILKHPEQFTFGFTETHLPRGFAIVDSPDGTKVLHYEKNALLFQKHDKLSQALSVQPQAKRLASDVNQQLLQYAETHPERYAVINELWAACENDTYNRADVQAVLQHLPVLMTLDANQLQALKTICTDSGRIDLKKVDYLLRQVEPITQTFPASYDGSDIAAVHYSDEIGADQAQQAHALSMSIKSTLNQAANNAHSLYQVVDFSNAAWQPYAKYLDGLNNRQMNALFDVYNQYGEPGLTKLFSSWQAMPERDYQFVRDNIIAHANTMAPFLQDDFVKACQRLIGLSGAEKEWAMSLMSQHFAATGHGDMNQLLDGFEVFRQFVSNKGLTFTRPVAFTDVHNMPVAMSRMIHLLENCDQQDLAEQWACIDKIPLGSDTLGYALNNTARSQPLNVVTPDLKIDPVRFERNGYAELEQWKSLVVLLDSGQDYRYLRFAAQQEHRLPMDFYRQAFALIDSKKYSAKTKNYLKMYVLNSTTGLNNRHHLTDIQSALSDVEKICYHFDNCAIPVVRGMAQDALSEQFMMHKEIPPLPVFSRLVRLIYSATKIPLCLNPIERLQTKIERVEQADEELQQHLRNYGNFVYKGMRHYTDVDFDSVKDDNDSLFYQHLKVSNNIQRFSYENFNCNTASPYLIGSISTFHLKENDLESVFSAFRLLTQVNNGIDALVTAMSIISDCETDRANDKILTAVDLVTTLEELVPMLHGLSYRDMIAVVQQHIDASLGNYFPPEYFTRLQSEGIPDEINQLITRKFEDINQRDQVVTLLNRFTKKGESVHFESIVRDLAQLTEKMSRQEAEFFFEVLLFPGLYSSPDAEQFKQTVDGMMQRGGVDDFIYLLAQPNAQTADSLTTKATYYLTELLPTLDRVCQAQNKSAQLSKADILPLLTQQLLQSDIAEFDAQIQVERDDANDVRQLLELLSRTTTRLNAGQDIDLTAFKDQLVALQADMPLFSDTLDELVSHAQRTLRQQEVADRQQALATQQAEPNGFQKVVGGVKSFFGKIFSKGEKKPQQTVSAVVQVARAKLDASILNDTQSGVNELLKHRTDYKIVLVDFFGNMNKLLKQYPGTKRQLLQFQSYFMNGGSIAHKWQEFNKLSTTLLELDENIVRSLLFHFDTNEGEFNATDLVTLFDTLAPVDKELRHSVLKVATLLLNNEKHFTLDELNDFIETCAAPGNGVQLSRLLPELYESAPFPSIQQLQAWHEEACESSNYDVTFKRFYQEFELEPAPREAVNGFHIEEAAKQAAQITGYQYTYPELVAFDQAVKAARSKTVEQLMSEFQSIKDQQPLNYEQLTAVSAELLYRAKAKDGGLGSTFEINTTQYLAIHSLLKAGQHVTGGIGTGEGKSRITAVLNACQFAQGKTVDFVTADVALATRDFLEFQAYYGMLGAESNLILASTSASDYKIGGINYSDATQLGLFRNKAKTEGLKDSVLAPNPNDRALVLDEADKTYFDVADTRFNYSTTGDPALSKMEWIYPVLIEYFSQDDPSIMELFQQDIDSCNERFMQFARNRLPEDRFARLQNVSQAQIEAWHQSAVVALMLELNEDYAIQPDATIQTPYGPKISSQAKLMADGRVKEGSKYSAGVHQCLHARLNILKATPRENIEAIESDPERKRLLAIKDKLDHCKQIFHVDDEKQIIYSSTSKGLLDDYSEGNLVAVTGTPGSIIEQEEASPLYGTGANTMAFLDIPRHRGLHRVDHAIKISKNSDAQLNEILHDVLLARSRNQPILLICEDDGESELLATKLAELLAERGHDPSLMQRVHSSSEDEPERIKQAGKPGMLTISTSMLGRGTDIKIRDESAKAHGLCVRSTYLMSEREMVQIFGRSGRAGQKGDARLILDKDRLMRRLGKTTLKDGMYTQTETYIRREQALMDRKAQVERLIKNTQTDFRRLLQDNYYESLVTQVPESERECLKAPWMRFMDEVDKLWTDNWPRILADLDPLNPDTTIVNQRLAGYQEKVADKWTQLCRQVESEKLSVNPKEHLFQEIPKLELSSVAAKNLTGFSLKQVVPHQVKVYDKYEPAHDGRAVIYKRRFEKLRAVFRGERNLFADVKAWWKGTGLLFPNLTALFRGHIGFGEFFTGYRKPQSSEVEPLKPTEHEEPSVEPDDVPMVSSNVNALLSQQGMSESSTPVVGAGASEVDEPLPSSVQSSYQSFTTMPPSRGDGELTGQTKGSSAEVQPPEEQDDKVHRQTVAKK